MQVSIDDLKKVFKKLEIESVQCSHHVRGFLVVDGKRILALHYSNGRKDMPGSVGHLFRRSLLLKEDEFARLIKCTLGRSDYVELLREKGVISNNGVEK